MNFQLMMMETAKKPFDFLKDYVLEDERVLLRPLELADLDYFIPFSNQEPDLWKYSLMQPNTPDKMKEYIHAALAERAAKCSYPFIVYDKASGEYAGCTRFYDISLPFQSLQLGYTWYGKRFQGTGLNTHCKGLLLRFAFEEMNMERVQFIANVNNTRSIAAMKRIGCTVEGVLRAHIPDGTEGKRRDSIVLSILRTEWSTLNEH